MLVRLPPGACGGRIGELPFVATAGSAPLPLPEGRGVNMDTAATWPGPRKDELPATATPGAD